MNDISGFENICRAMSRPSFYPHDTWDLQRRDTHISTVFLAGPWVYKLKKPVTYDFLDFSKLEDREIYCKREVWLNRRLSRGVYHDVVAIYRNQDGKFSFAPEGDVVEYAVKMTRLPEDRCLSNLIKKRKIHIDHITTLGRMMAAFYEKAGHSSDIDGFGTHEMISYNMEENFKGIEPFAGQGHFNFERWEFIRQVCRAFLSDHQDLFKTRIAAGRIRDGHGDLRTEHVYYHNGIQVIDCIEFNDRFRYGDAALDLAFLIMDLDHLDRDDLGMELLASYAASAEDPGVYKVLDFYVAYRALVRLKIGCLSLGESGWNKNKHLETDIRRYLNQAYCYSLMFGRPSIWVFFGLPASGKSTLALKVAEVLSISVFQSDAEREKALPFSPHGPEPFDTGAYRLALRNRVYARLMSLAQECIEKGRSVILDATFLQPKWQQWVHGLAKDMDTDVIWVQSFCKRETAISRLKQRELDPKESDARLSHFLEMEKRAVPFVPENPGTHFIVDTDQTVGKALIKVLSGAYAAKRAQVKFFL